MNRSNDIRAAQLSEIKKFLAGRNEVKTQAIVDHVKAQGLPKPANSTVIKILGDLRYTKIGVAKYTQWRSRLASFDKYRPGREAREVI